MNGLTKEQREILEHALGIGSNHQARNSYFTHDLTPEITQLVDGGYMELTKQPPWGGYYYRVTQAGRDLLAAQAVA